MNEPPVGVVTPAGLEPATHSGGVRRRLAVGVAFVDAEPGTEMGTEKGRFGAFSVTSALHRVQRFGP